MKFIVPELGVQNLGQGQCAHIVKFIDLLIFFRTVTVVGEKVMYCLQSHNVLMLNSGVRGLQAIYAVTVKAGWGIKINIYWTRIYFYIGNLLVTPINKFTINKQFWFYLENYVVNSHLKIMNWYADVFYFTKSTL